MVLKNYERLCYFYNVDWGTWCLQHMSSIRQILSNHCPSKAMVLDLACGTGTLASALVSCGHNVVGIDLSEGMIKQARRRKLNGADFRTGDMSSSRFNPEFDMVTCTFDAFNYLLDTNKVQGFFLTAASALKENGILFFDFNTPILYYYHHIGTLYREICGESFLQERQFDIDSCIASTTFRFYDGVTEEHVQRAWRYEDIENALISAGLQTIELRGGLNDEPYTMNSERVVCLAKKVAPISL